MTNFKDRIHSIKYTINHRKAFLVTEKELTGRNTLRGYLHDVDKIFLKLFLSPETVSRLHHGYSHHHNKRMRTHDDFAQAVIDWECARITKPDKPLNARDTLYKFYPERMPEIVPVLEELNL